MLNSQAMSFGSLFNPEVPYPAISRTTNAKDLNPAWEVLGVPFEEKFKLIQ